MYVMTYYRNIIPWSLLDAVRQLVRYSAMRKAFNVSLCHLANMIAQTYLSGSNIYCNKIVAQEIDSYNNLNWDGHEAKSGGQQNF